MLRNKTLYIMEATYDIFISYRREGGAQYARILQLMLQQRGYRVFLDYDELTDGVFSDNIKKAIKKTPIFILILSKNAINRCVNENDWLRQEILLAVEEKKKIIPVNPDATFNGLLEIDDINAVPDSIKLIIKEYQHSEIKFGQTLGIAVDFMVKNRVEPILRKCGRPTDIVNPNTPNRELVNTNKTKRTISIKVAIIFIVLLLLAAVGYFWKNNSETKTTDFARLRDEMHDKYRDFNLYLSPDISVRQVHSVDKILQNLSEVKKDTLWMGQFEFNKGEWYGIQNITYEGEDSLLPITEVSYGEIYLFLGKLRDMTNLDFALPSVDEWVYAAKGGVYNDTTMYAGNSDANAVAWYKNNSGGKPHPSDGQQGMEPNMLDLYDMSGNVSELCNSPFKGDSLKYTICGGNFKSPITDVSITSRAPFAVNAKSPTVGFRIVMHNNSI